MSDLAPRPGELFRDEIRQQPDTFGRIADRSDMFAEVAATIRGRGLRTVRMVGHGSSDNAATYGIYAFTLLAGMTALRDSISLPVYYGATVDMSDSCVVALSQSGRTPDVLEYVDHAQRHGAHVVAVTNDDRSPLAGVADSLLALDVGIERAVAATKTYTGQLAALALLAAHIGGEGSSYASGLHAAARALRDALASMERSASTVASDLGDIQRIAVVGRGPEFATARELALKLLETCGVGALALTATDLAHGPIAALGPTFPVWVVAAPDASLPAVVEAAVRARAAGARVVACGAAAGELGSGALATPSLPLPLLSPLLSIVPGQLVAGALALSKGLDPDAPRGLAKVTIVP